jgi:hypothetical protein
MHNEEYICCKLNFNLVPKAINCGFCTFWFELSKNDLLNYESILTERDITYLKLFDNNKELVYSGAPLDVHELQHKIKHLTRIDTKLNGGLDETTLRKIQINL